MEEKIKKNKKTKWRAVKKIIFLIIIFWVLTFIFIITSDLFSGVMSSLSSINLKPKYKVEKIDESIEALNIPFINLTDRDGTLIGKGVLLKQNIFVAPDHLWDAGDKKLYYKKLPIKVLVRDYAQDLLFFKIKQQNFEKKVKWTEKIPSRYKDYYWRTDLNVHATQMVQTEDIFETSEKTIKNLVSFDADITHGDSGTPIFDDQGKIYGILIATDLRENKSYMIKSEAIKKLASEYLGL